jgi:hypothetical protein
MKERFYENRLRSCDRMFLTFTYKFHKKQGASVTPQNVTVEDGLTKCASEGNRGGKEANSMISCNPSNVGRNG